jgi:hypothetical protein
MKRLTGAGVALALLGGCTSLTHKCEARHAERQSNSPAVVAAPYALQPATHVARNQPDDQPTVVVLTSPADRTETGGASESSPACSAQVLICGEQGQARARSKQTDSGSHQENSMASPIASPIPTTDRLGAHIIAVSCKQSVESASPMASVAPSAKADEASIAEPTRSHSRKRLWASEATSPSGSKAIEDVSKTALPLVNQSDCQSASPIVTASLRGKQASASVSTDSLSDPTSAETPPKATVLQVVPATAREQPTPTSASAADENHGNTESSMPVVRMVNSKRISLNYELKDIGPAGVADVELWCTRDGQKWQKHAVMRHCRPPCLVEVDREDLYGFTMVVHGGGSHAGHAPQEGDRPQIWVEVDTTLPNVRILGIDAGVGETNRCLTITWRASDKNMGARPVGIAYALEAAGPWTMIAGQLENTGRYVWHMPADMPHHFLVRVDATDQAGNVGCAALPVDLAQPTATIVAVENGVK